MAILNQKKYYIKTFGCQMNHSDSERFASILEKINYIGVDTYEQADLIVMNSCSVKQKAEDRIFGLGRIVKKLKENNPELKIVLTGCMARRTWQGTSKTGSPIQMTQESREHELKARIPWVDFVLETKDFAKLPSLLGYKATNFEDPEHYLSYTPKYKNNFQAYVPISTGCDHFCTFCIVPFARGGEVCRHASEIISEVEELVAKGYKDITLLGQTVNRWINPIYDQEMKKGMIANTRIPELNKHLMDNPFYDDPKDFLQLLQRLDQIEGDYWFTFVSSHPNYMTEELLEFLSKSIHFRPYLHFALQSGSDKILKRMNRRHEIAEFVEKTLKFKDIIPGVGLSTDIIVGFPGETLEDLEETAKAMQMMEFDMAFISEFSPRKGTAAGLLPDSIEHQEKERRKTYLNDEILAKTAFKNNQKMLNTKQKVLVESQNRNGSLLARTGNYKEVTIKNNSDKNLIGSFVVVTITDCTPWALEGEI
jgi:tRNA-2-methylthio-N6-dimethylallyladenosine synthase